MVFSSLTFLYLFLPLAVLPYFLVKNRTWRNGLLLVLSLFFYAWGEPKYVVMMLAATVVAYAGGWPLRPCGAASRPAKWLLS